MNRQIAQLFGLVALLFGLLVVFTSRWTVFEAEGLEDNTANRRPLLQEQRIPRGRILASDNRTVLARSVPRGRGDKRVYTRVYPERGLFAHPDRLLVPAQRPARPRALPQRRADRRGGRVPVDPVRARGPDARGLRRGHEPRRGRPADGVRGPPGPQGRGGGDRAAHRKGPRDGLGSRLRPEPDPRGGRRSSGRIRTSRSSTARPRRPTRRGRPSRWSPPRRRSTAARSRPTTVIDGSSPRTVSGAPLENFGGTDFGPITVTDALTNSVNTVFAQIGEEVGRSTLVEYMQRYGFYEDPKLDFPEDEMIASGVRSGGRRARGRRLRRRPRGHRAGWRSRARSGPRRCRWPRWPPPSPTVAA